MAVKAKQQYYADNVTLKKEAREFWMIDELKEKLDSVEWWAQVNVIEEVQENWVPLEIVDKTVNVLVPEVIDNLYTIDPNNSLSAKQWKILYDMIKNLLSRWRFLSTWNTATWLPLTNPEESPYPYKAWDYYIVWVTAQEGWTNFRPEPVEYVINVASDEQETSEVHVSDIYVYDWEKWILLINSTRELAVDNYVDYTYQSTNPVENQAIARELVKKQNIFHYIWNTAPTPQNEWDEWYDTANDVLKVWDWTQWVEVWNWETYTAWLHITIDPNDNNKISVVEWSATASSLWLVKLGSDTVQSTSPNNVTSTTWRTYRIQANGSWQLMVNVPWTDTTYLAWTGISISNNRVISCTVKPVTVWPTAPSTPGTWDLWYDTNKNTMFLYKNNAWTIIGPEIYPITKADYDALTPAEQWDGRFFLITDNDWTIYVDWDNVQNRPMYIWTTSPDNPCEWYIWYDTTNDVLKVYDWTQWNEVWGWTTYTAWNWISISNGEISIDTTVVATKTDLSSKQDTISDLATIRSWASAWATAVQPNDNVSELTNDAWYITSSALDDYSTTTEMNNAISTATSWLATESYVDTALSSKQDTLTAWANITIAQDWTISATDTTYTAWTGIDITNWVISSTQTSAEWWNITGTLSNQTDLQNALDGKQDVLVSWTNIKTVNNTSLLGNGNIDIPSGKNDIVISEYTAPADDSVIWYDIHPSSDSSYRHFKYYDWYAWTEVERIYYDSSAPTSINLWDLWYDTNYNVLKYYDYSTGTWKSVWWIVTSAWDWINITSGEISVDASDIAWTWLTVSNNNLDVDTTVVALKSDLANYYTKTETYTKTEVDNLISSFWNFEVVASLPSVSTASEKTIYLLWPIWTGADKYEEWIVTEETAPGHFESASTVDHDFVEIEWASGTIWNEDGAIQYKYIWINNINPASTPEWYFIQVDDRADSGVEKNIYADTPMPFIWTDNISQQIRWEKPVVYGYTPWSFDIYYSDSELTWVPESTTKVWTKIWETSVDLSWYATTTALTNWLAAKQDTLVSGTNIKTVNNNSLLGSGNIDIPSGKNDIVTSVTAPSDHTVLWIEDNSWASGTNELYYYDNEEQEWVKFNWIYKWSNEPNYFHLWYDTSDEVLKASDSRTSGSFYPICLISYWDSSPSYGDLWYDDLNSALKYYDEEADEWIAIRWPYVGSTAPVSAFWVVWWMWYDTTNNVMKYYDGSTWASVGWITYTAWDGIDITNGEISVDASDLAWTWLSTDGSNNLIVDTTVVATQTDLSWKQDKATSGSIAPSTTPTYVWQQYIDTTADKMYVATGTSSSSDWTEVGAWSWDMLYSDFWWDTLTWASVTLSLRSEITPSANFTVNKPNDLKDWQFYVLRVITWETAYTMTLGTDVTNPYSEDLTLSANTIANFTFLAKDWELELQPSTEAPSYIAWTWINIDANNVISADTQFVVVDTLPSVSTANENKVYILWPIWTGTDKYEEWIVTETNVPFTSASPITKEHIETTLSEGSGEIVWNSNGAITNAYVWIDNYQTTNTAYMFVNNYADSGIWLWEISTDTQMPYLIKDWDDEDIFMEVPQAWVYGQAGEELSFDVYYSSSPLSLAIEPVKQWTKIWETSPDLSGKQDKATSGSTAPSTTPTYIWQQYVDTTNDILYVATGTTSSSDWTEVGAWSWDMLYADFNWATKTWETITLDLNSTITPSANFTVNAPATIKDGQVYILRVINWLTVYTMTLGTWITNPYSTSTALTSNWVDQFVFQAIGWSLELLPDIDVDISGKQDKATSWSSTPPTAPSYIGQQYVDTTSIVPYIATWTTWTSRDDWQALPILSKQNWALLSVKIWVWSQTDYEALSTKDPNTLYFTTNVVSGS